MKIATTSEIRAAFEDIDCLICHTANYFYSKAGIREVKQDSSYSSVGFRAYYLNEIDSSKVTSALNAVYSKPLPSSCGFCHNFSAGGPAFKRGFWYQEDVHLEANKLICTDCHEPGVGGNKHEFKIGKMPDLFTVEVSAKQCTDCHTGTIHANQVLNDHYKRVDCRTCHIPVTIGLRQKDFTQRVVATDSYYTTNNMVVYESLEIAGSGKKGWAVNEGPRKPSYFFLGSGWQEEKRHGIKPGLGTDKNNPKNKDAKIMPFNDLTVIGYADKATGNILPMKAGMYFSNIAIWNVVYNGVLDWQTINRNNPNLKLYDTFMASFDPLKYNSQSNFDQNAVVKQFPTSYYQMDHRIRPASEALKCVDCHSSSGAALNYDKLTQLGYSSKRAKLLIFVK
ncbi:hypothetical protein ciss_15270 [Carboxydothermus islandicus]|uniref:Cytochrome c7-like domain-containing protein n=2 Tax=Carboxydothermus islandicus TaxID=661089 RepID=A0A1L8D3C4_9THEO|nr:hypothetical protein ciss_15270 [Carboxydothermus islandicus]